MNRAVVFERFGGPDALTVVEAPDVHAGPGQVRVRIVAAGLNPFDWLICTSPAFAAARGVTVPSGFGFDLAGRIDEVGVGADEFTVGGRVFGRALCQAAADYAVMPAVPSTMSWLLPTPDDITDREAAALPTPGLTATAALKAVDVRRGDTVLIGGAAGGVGVLATQMARLAGARVIGTASPGTFDFLRALGAEPVEYGPGLIDRVWATDFGPPTAAVDLFDAETAKAAVALGVSRTRIVTIAAGDKPSDGFAATGGADAEPADLQPITEAVRSGAITIPIAAKFTLEQIRDAVTLQAARHTHGKIIVDL